MSRSPVMQSIVIPCVLCIFIAWARTTANCLRSQNIRLDFLFFPCSEYENFPALTKIGTQLGNSSITETDFLLLPGFSLSNWTYIVPPFLAELVEVRMWVYYTVLSKPLHSLSSTSKLSVNCTLASTQSLHFFSSFLFLWYQYHHSNYTEKHLCDHLLFNQPHKL